MGSRIKAVARCLFGLVIAFIDTCIAITTCLSVEVAGAEGSLSGIYDYNGANFIRRGGSTSYILGKYSNDQWRLGQGDSLYYALSNYPHYYTYDTNGHPVDVVEAWQLVATAGNEEEAPSNFSISCAVDPTPSPTLALAPSPSSLSTSRSTSPSTPLSTSPSTPPSTSSSTPLPTSLDTSPSPTPATPSTPTPLSGDSSPLTPTMSPQGVPTSTSNPVGSTPPASEIACTIDTPCPDDKCCNPDTNQCGRTPDYCQERSGKMVCCPYALQDLSSKESCFEDNVCEERQWYETAWWALASVIVIPIVYDCFFTGKIREFFCDRASR